MCSQTLNGRELQKWTKEKEKKCIKHSRNSMILIIAQVGFAELEETADDRANIGGTIIGAPIIGL